MSARYLASGATKLRCTRTSDPQDSKLAGSHRAPRSTSRTTQPTRTSKRAVALAVVVGLVPALWFTGQRLVDDDKSPASNTPTELPIPPVTTPGTPTAVPTTPRAAPSTPVGTPTARASNLPGVAPDVPRKLLSSGLLDVGFDDSVEPTSNGSFQAASTAEVARWGTRGQPGSPGPDTVYVIGKTFLSGVSALDTLPRIEVGAEIAIRTDSGSLTYTVRSVADKATAGLAKNAAFAAKVPGRLVVVGIRYDRSGDLTGRAVVVTAQLSGAVAR